MNTHPLDGAIYRGWRLSVDCNATEDGDEVFYIASKGGQSHMLDWSRHRSYEHRHFRRMVDLNFPQRRPGALGPLWPDDIDRTLPRRVELPLAIRLAFVAHYARCRDCASRDEIDRRKRFDEVTEWFASMDAASRAFAASKVAA